MLSIIGMLAVLASAVVLDDLGPVDKTDSDFWDVSEHAGVSVFVNESTAVSTFDSVCGNCDVSPGTAMETRYLCLKPTGPMPFDSTKTGFLLFLR